LSAELFLLLCSQMCSNSWQLLTKHAGNTHNAILMPGGTVRLRLVDHHVACSLSTTVL